MEICWTKSNFPSKIDFKSDEDKKKYSLASCEGIIKFHHTLLVIILIKTLAADEVLELLVGFEVPKGADTGAAHFALDLESQPLHHGNVHIGFIFAAGGGRLGKLKIHFRLK